MSTSMSPTGMTPYVQIAAFCHTVLREASGGMSLIRIADRHLIQGGTPEMQPTTINLTLAVILKSGNMEGSATMTIRPNDPDETPLPAIQMPVLFEGRERGVGLVSQMSLMAKKPGLYWFDVLIDGVLLTRIPLRILYHQAPQISIVPPQATTT